MKLSIVVPVYNTQEYLPKCLDSMLGTDVDGVEVIAVNDGSTDQSAEILERYSRLYPERLRVVETPNGGLGHARNTGIRQAKGDYVLFVDSDDWLAPHAVPEILSFLDSSFDIAVFDFAHVDDTGRVLAEFRGCDQDESFRLDEYPEFLFAPHNAVNKIWKKTLFTENEISFPDRIWFEDLATVPKLYLFAERIQPIRKTWYCYYQRQGSIMLNASKAARNAEMIEAVNSVISCYRGQGAFEQYRQQLEYKFYYEEYLASVTRVNQIDAHSPVQAVLRDDYLQRFPAYRDNPYVRAASYRLRMLDGLIREGRWNAVSTLIRLNKKRKGR